MYQILYKTKHICKLFDDFNDCLTPASSIIIAITATRLSSNGDTFDFQRLPI